MTRGMLLLLVAAPALFGGAHAQNAPAPRVDAPVRAAAKPASDVPPFDSFKLVLDRDIFDPNRVPTRPNERRREPRPVTYQPPPPERLDLLGTYMRGDQGIAFIDGVPAPPVTAAQVGTTISQMRITHIDTASVELSSAKGKITWLVGQRLERAPGEAWHLAGTAPAASSSGAPAAGGSDQDDFDFFSDNAGSGSGEKPAAATPAENDVLKQMMERRQKENKS